MNSLRGTLSLSEPPTRAPSAMRHVLFVSPSQPLKVLPSKRGPPLEASAACAATTTSDEKRTTSDLFMFWSFVLGSSYIDRSVSCRARFRAPRFMNVLEDDDDVLTGLIHCGSPMCRRECPALE